MKGCAGADRALDMNLARMFLNDAVGDGESQARCRAGRPAGAWSWW